MRADTLRDDNKNDGADFRATAKTNAKLAMGWWCGLAGSQSFEVLSSEGVVGIDFWYELRVLSFEF